MEVVEVDQTRMADATIIAEIKKHYAALAKAIDAAIAAGLKVECTIDASDTYNPSTMVTRVRGRNITATRTY